MSVQQNPAPVYASDPKSLDLPSVPKHEILSSHNNDVSNFPNLKYLALPPSAILPTNAVQQSARSSELQNSPNGSQQHPLRSTIDRQQWQSPIMNSNIQTQQAAYTTMRTSMETEPMSPTTDGGSARSVDEHMPRASSVSIDDPDVRIAAEALSGLGKSGKRFFEC
jgi:transcriptional repressor OPI1